MAATNQQDDLIADLKARYGYGIACVLKSSGEIDSHRYGKRRLPWSEILIDGLGRREIDDLGGDVIQIYYPDHEDGLTLHYFMTPRAGA